MKTYSLLICLLGNLRLQTRERTIALSNSGKTGHLLATLALRCRSGVTRDALLALIWPNHNPTLAAQSLHSLVHTLHKQFDDVLGGARPILYRNGYYQLNLAAGVAVDFNQFDLLIDRANQQLERDDIPSAIASFKEAISLYRGDLEVGTDIYGILERERLRASYLDALAQLAEYAYREGAYSDCLAYAQQLLSGDPCREDAHRLVMACYVRRGQRTQALRQYHLCAEILRVEFEATPEPATIVLYEQVRRAPDSI